MCAKGLHREEQNKFSKKFTSHGDGTWNPMSLGPLVIHSHVFLTDLTWHVLIEGYLT